MMKNLQISKKHSLSTGGYEEHGAWDNTADLNRAHTDGTKPSERTGGSNQVNRKNI